MTLVFKKIAYVAYISALFLRTAQLLMNSSFFMFVVVKNSKRTRTIQSRRPFHSRSVIQIHTVREMQRDELKIW